MIILKAVKSILNAHAGLTALVSTRIYHQIISQDSVLPAVSFMVVTNIPVSAMGVDTGLEQARIQIDCHGDTDQSALLVADQVSLALTRYSGVVATITIQDSFRISETEGYNHDIDDFVVSHDYKISYLLPGL